VYKKAGCSQKSISLMTGNFLNNSQLLKEYPLPLS